MLESTPAGPERSLNRFQPVYVASGTASSGIFTPARPLPSASTCGTRIGNAVPIRGGSTVTTDTLGNYSLSAIGSVTVTSAMRGRFCNVDRCQYDSNLLTDVCPSGDASFARNATDPSTVDDYADFTDDRVSA